jgi:ElaB/YqjD/DUF883 family membrane-anchored ribosome-binding protein
MNNSSTGPDRVERVTAEDVLEDLRTVVRDAEALLRATEGQVGERVEEIRSRVEETLDGARERLQAAAEGKAERVKAVAKSADTYVRENPWVAVAVAVGLGYLIGRASRRD